MKKQYSIKKKVVILLIICLIGVGYLVFNKYVIPIPCFFLEITGFYCPGCGMTRFVYALLDGNVYQAFRYNQLGFIFLPFFITYIISEFINFVFNFKFNIIQKIPKWFIYFLLIIAILFGILRNIQYFSYLQPTKI